jgi:hypothetical protein
VNLMNRQCEHDFVDVHTGRHALPLVNVLAPPGKSQTMTRGRKYRCARCDKILDLRPRARLPLPERPTDNRIGDPVEILLMTLPERELEELLDDTGVDVSAVISARRTLSRELESAELR